MESTSDEHLVQLARQGDERAFGRLVQRHERQVRGIVQNMLGDTDEAKDAAQEVFLRFYRALDNFRGDANLSTYLGRIAINVALTHSERRKRRRWLSWGAAEANALIPETADQSHDPARAELRDALRHALGRLEPDFRAVVVLRLVEGYSVKETADMLKLPTGTVASRLSRAQRQLRETLKGVMDN